MATKSDYYDEKIRDIRTRQYERQERQEWQDLHKKHQLNQSIKKYTLDLKKERSKKNRYFLGLFGRFLLVSFCVILLVLLFRRFKNNDNSFGFTGLLEFISQLNSVEVNFSIKDFLITDNWGLLNSLRDFFNSFNTILGVLFWLFNNVLNVFRYLLAFILFLFA